MHFYFVKFANTVTQICIWVGILWYYEITVHFFGEITVLCLSKSIIFRRCINEVIEGEML